MQRRYLAALVAAFAATTAHADTPAFDRPGIAFSTTTLPRGGVSWEQGLPDFQRDDDGGTRATQYAANTNLRIGLADGVEVQVSGSPFNVAHVRGAPTERGGGDSGVAVKIALPSRAEKFSWAVLAGATFDTGSRAFTNGDTEYSLATTFGYDLSDVVSSSLYLAASRSGGESTRAWSPGLGFTVSERFGAFFEAGFEYPEHGPATRVAGGGVTWMATPRLQLDFSMDFGVNDAAPDVQGGIGFSLYFE
ncbi:transporter [Tahibacter soli]|uniref:Transporter n=1 Tax=Tahibacter soli TaxID=2983605 RepID=A0A9X4BLS7_9GAMM|nr:transporter [Tahibacter soli]MDC8015672.1 transporter [Tahibacter soli]